MSVEDDLIARMAPELTTTNTTETSDASAVEQQETTPTVDANEPAVLQTEQSNSDSSTGDISSQSTTKSNTAKPQTETAVDNRGTRVDKHGNITDTQGNIIAAAGAERRQFEKLRYDYATMQQQHTTVMKELEAYKTAASAYTAYGLSPVEMTSGMQLMASYKRDPVGVVSALLTELRAAGHNIDGMGGQVDLGAIRSMINEAVKPFTDDRAKETEIIQQQTALVKQVQDFYGKFPDAKLHENELAELLNRDTTLSLDEAYYRLRLAVAERNLDWSKPLSTQLQARNNQSPTSTTQNRSMTAGRAVTTTPVQTHTTAANTSDTSYRDIVREVMLANGYQL